MATTGGEKEEKANPKTVKKTKVNLEESVEAIEEIPNEKPQINYKRPVSSGQYYQPSSSHDTSSSGEDQNTVLSFNVIQYIFERFKFSEEVY